MTTTLSPHLQDLENESIHILREVAGQFDKVGLLFSGGKDSCVVFELVRRAFAPQTVPFELVHIDTGHNFPEVIQFRDELVAETGARLHVAKVQDWIDRGDLQERPDGTRNPLQSVPLVETIAERGYDAVLGGARRDEERARAKERIFSVRDSFGGWDPRRSALSCGICTTAEKWRAKIFAYSRFRTGPKPISGSTSGRVNCACRIFTTRTSVNFSTAMACGSLLVNGEARRTMNRCS